MRILLIGEFSRLHNSLKEGLIANGHQVTLIANGDGFKNYPADLSIKGVFFSSVYGTFIKKIVHRLFKYDLVKLEHGIRFYFHLNKLKHFDVVQFINESPIQTHPRFEQFLLQKIVANNGACFLLCCGPDYNVVQYLMSKKERYSIMNPYFENTNSKEEYQFILEFISENHYKLHHFLQQKIRGIIATDIDYHLPMQNNPKYIGLIPNPINISKINYENQPISGKIIIFLGINRSTYYTKGISFFEEALKIISQKYGNSIEIIISENVPYLEYLEKYNSCHILLDQVYGFDQGYNALEAMAKGKVVFTGAESEFYTYYKIDQKIAINTLPSVSYIVEELSNLIENPSEITKIGFQARQFVEHYHDYIKIANLYENLWVSN